MPFVIDVATLIVVVVDVVMEYGAYIAAASAVYQNVAASDSQRRARNQARDRYNAALTDRTVTFPSAESPWRICYGEVVTGGRVVAQLTYGDRDQYQAVVVVWADHECDAITDVQLNGESLGTLDSQGRVTGGRWTKEQTDTPSESITFDGGGHATLGRPASGLVSISYTQQVTHTSGSGESTSTWYTDEDVVIPAASLSIAGQVVTRPALAGRTVRANYSSNAVTPYVRVRHHLGAMDQAADAYLLATVPSSQWTASDRLAGKCYSVFEFCLDHAELQSGPPKMTVRLRGKKVFDHRTGTTAWSPNAALCTVDYLRGEYGKAQPDNTIDWPSWDAAANVCAEAMSAHGGAMRYRCDGVVDTSSDSDQVLQQLTGAMAGSAVYQGLWYGLAGAYTAPVMDLGPADNAGSVEVVGSPQGLEVFNGLRGQFYDRDRYDQLTDYTPYQNAGFKAVDGADWWGPLNLPFTAENWRAHNLARIEVERSRGMTVLFPAKQRAIKLRPGQRVRLSNPVLGLSLAIFRLVKKEWRPGGTVGLTLVQDDPSFWDDADAPAPLASPAAAALDPFTVAAPLSFSVASNEGVAVRDLDGSVISRARASWLPTDDGLVQRGGALQIEVRLADSETWARLPEVGPSATQADLQGLQDQRLYAVRARWRNSWGQVSDWRATYVYTQVPVIQGGGQAGAGLVNWVASGSAQAQGNTLSAGAGVTNLGQAWLYSVERYRGGAQVMCTTQQSGTTFLLGLSTTPTGSWGGAGDYFISRGSDNVVNCVDPGGISSVPGTYGAGTALAVRYDGSRVQWLINGNVVRDVSAAAGLLHAAKWEPAATGVQVVYATFMPVVAGAAGATGPAGAAGPQGPAGPTGATLYTWIAYANSADGSSGFTTGANTGQAYIGIANNKTTATESTNPADYTWSLIKGDQGVPGTPGANGAPTYTWFAYANSADGSSGFTNGAWSGQSYLGIAANKLTATESSNPADYSWSLIKGDAGATGPAGAAGPQGPAGPTGATGAAGATLYTWIAYANSADGSSGFTTGANTGQAYIGIANNKTTATESTNPADYTWSLIKGDQGVPGTPGANGAPTYTWFAYANSADGSSGFTTGGWSGQSYLGIAANKATATESTNPADYTWSLIQGAPGANSVLYVVTFSDATGVSFSNFG